MLNIDGDQISIGIDLDQGGRLASLQWRDMQFVVPFNGDVEVMKDLEGNEMRNEDGSIAMLDETGLPAIQNNLYA